jgi:GxxExxY protein
MITDVVLGDAVVSEAAYPHHELTHIIIGAAMTVHNELGNGFLERVYENALLIELRARGVAVASQLAINIAYKGQSVGSYVADVVVEGAVLCELKAMDQLLPIHHVQTLHYLKATRLPVGLLINFGAPRLQFKRLIL